MWPSLPSAWLGTAPGTVSRVSSLAAAARLWGAAWASPQDWGPGRCARAPAVRSASSPMRAGPVPRCQRPWRARRAVSLPRSEWSGRSFLGLPRALSFGASRDDRASQRASSAFCLLGRRSRGAGTALEGASWALAPGGALRPRSLSLAFFLQTAPARRAASSILSLQPARPHACLFSCLTNPRIIQLRKCWKEVR